MADDKRPSVLLVDDIEANLVALRALLEDMNCDLVLARGGDDALRQLLRREFAIMLLDVQMPEMDGYEVATHARSNPATCEVPIIFLTAAHEGEDGMLRGYGSGAVDFLQKPLNPHVLRAKVRVFLDLYLSRSRLRGEIAAHEQTLSALERANKAMRHFTNAASHDLKAPLRRIKGFLTALDEDCGAMLNEAGHEYVDRCLTASQRMDALLDSLLEYARLQRPIMLEDVDCGALLQLVCSDLADRIERAHAAVVVDALPHVRGDERRLYQLFLNLVGNALKFQRPSEAPKVNVSAVQEAGGWRFCVADNGIGIDLQYRESVFDAFQRLHNESAYEGSGLGLAICSEIVEQHGGRIWVESEVGVGSRFYFILPAGVDPAP
jgi:signal transduction histidine kinase